MRQCKNTSLINPFTLATVEPMQRIYMDTIGPVNSNPKVIEANKGLNYVLVIIDAFSRFVQLYAVEDTSADSALNSFVQWISNFGVPSEITTDNGTQFVNRLSNLSNTLRKASPNLFMTFNPGNSAPP